jgi:hypothetical protein
MGNTHQTPLGFHFILPTQMESAETHILFHNAKYGLHFGGALCAQLLSSLGGEVGSGLAAVFP